MRLHMKKRSRYTVQMPLTALIDIVFLLLIYFLLTTNFLVDEGIKIKLPQAKASAPQVDETITVFVDKEGRAFLDSKEISLGALFDQIKERLKNNRERVVIIRADRNVLLNKAVKVMDLAKAAGAGRLCLATEKPLAGG